MSANAADARVYEFLLKDEETDAIISVRRNVTTYPSNNPDDYMIYGRYPNFGYEKGDKVSIVGYVKNDNALSGYNATKKYLAASTPISSHKSLIVNALPVRFDIFTSTPFSTNLTI